jgi:hypothetical protein
VIDWGRQGNPIDKQNTSTYHPVLQIAATAAICLSKINLYLTNYYTDSNISLRIVTA